MTIFGEVVVEVVQSLWSNSVDAAYKRWGWKGGIVTFFGPVALLALLVWAAHH
ncbi:MAG: hypothetical protein PGN12_12975 [Sphingomonas phyllosphaerae]